MPESTNFWRNLGNSVAQGSKVAAQGTVTGMVWLGRGTTAASSAIATATVDAGKAFKEEWTRQEKKEVSKLVEGE